MLSKKITFEDLNGDTITQTFYFNLYRSEIAEMEMSVAGGLSEALTRMAEAKDGVKIMSMFRDLILRAYGEKSPDGKQFIKSQEMSIAFSQTPAYDILFMELITEPEAASAFVNAIVPKQK